MRTLLEIQNTVLKRMALGMPTPALLTSLCDGIETLWPDVVSSILVVSNGRLRDGAGPALPADLRLALDGTRIIDIGLCGAAAATRTVVVIDDVESDPRGAEHRGLLRAHGLRGCWALPVASSTGELFGTMACFTRARRRPSAHELEHLEELSHLAGIILEKERTAAELEESKRQRMRADERMRAELPYRLVSLATRDAVWDWDLITNEVRWNDAVTELLGYEREDVEQSPEWWLAHVHVDDQDRVASSRRELIAAGGTHWQAEYRFHHFSGRIITVLDRGTVAYDEQGRAARMVGAMQDVTAQRELRVLEERLRLAVASAAIGTWDYTLSDRALVMDWRAKELFGLSGREEPLVAQLFEVMHEEDRLAVYEAARDALNPESSGELHVRFRCIGPNDGEPRWLEIAGHAAFEDGKAVRVVGVLRDIGDDKRVETALREADRRKNEFMAMLGHELRNPLAPILTALQLMRMKGQGGEHERAVIERQVRHLVGLVEDLLDVSRITRGSVSLKMQALEMSTVVARAVELASPLFDERAHRLEVDVQESGLTVNGDPVRLAQIVANLLTNAAKYTERGGHIRVHANTHGDRVCLRVKDDGIGIEPALIGRVFDLFVQGERALDHGRGGLGLGLPLAQRLARLHDGDLTVHSEGEGCGSEFVLTLPRVAPIAAPHVPGPAPARGRKTSRRVLIVDDNEDAAELIAELLRQHGHEVAMAFDGPHALRMAQEFRPTVVVLDIALPSMNGYEVARLLRESSGDALRIIGLSGFGQASDRLRSARAGFDAHLVKPIDIEALLELIPGERIDSKSSSPAPASASA